MNSENSSRSPRWRGYLFMVVASAILLMSLLLSLGTFNPPAATSSVTEVAATSYSVAASSVLDSAAAQAPAGYVQASSRQLNPTEAGLVSGGYATYSTQAGSLANMTVLVFDAPQSARTYTDSVIANAKGLPGYADVSSSLASYQHYGVCYGFAQTDPDGNGAVATGVCAKGNVYIQVHLVSPSSLSSAVGDMSGLVGAAYRGTG